MRFDRKLRVDYVELLMKGVRCTKYTSVRKLLSSVRSVDVARELSEDFGVEGDVYLINFRGVKVIVLPDHVHVLGDVSRERAEEIVKGLEELLSKQNSKTR